MMWLVFLLACVPTQPEPCITDRECVAYHLEEAHGHAVMDDAWTVVPLIEDARNENGKR